MLQYLFLGLPLGWWNTKVLPYQFMHPKRGVSGPLVKHSNLRSDDELPSFQLYPTHCNGSVVVGCFGYRLMEHQTQSLLINYCGKFWTSLRPMWIVSLLHRVLWGEKKLGKHLAQCPAPNKFSNMAAANYDSDLFSISSSPCAVLFAYYFLKMEKFKNINSI